jgi:hypothetical protein
VERTIVRGFDLQEDGQAQELTTGRAGLREEDRLLCLACGHPITSRRERIQEGGAHEHAFANPAGCLFHIGCFARAPGCLQAGQPTLEHTWFPGRAWRYALCGGCRAHLGWAFLGGQSSFYGLILDRLREAGGGADGQSGGPAPGP